VRELVEVIDNAGIGSEAIAEFVAEIFVGGGNLGEERRRNQSDDNNQASNHGG